jgi:ribonucleoside-triphosphate reductase
MGCRSFLGVYEENGEQIHDGRNNLGVISLNLPRIALEAKGDEATSGSCWISACSWRAKR